MIDYSNQLGEIIKTLDQIRSAVSKDLSAIVSGIAAIASLIAALVGLWAASSAFRASRNAQRIARFGMLRNLIQVGYDVISEVEQVKSLVDKIRTQITTLAQFMGHGPGSMVDRIISEADAKYQGLVRLQQETQKLIHDRTSLESNSDEELSKQSSKFDGHLSTVRRVKHLLEKEAESDAAQNRMHQMNVINKTP